MAHTKHLFISGSQTTLDIVLQGGSYGIESEFLQKVIEICKINGDSVLAFNFEFFERNESRASGPELKEELQTLDEYLNEFKADSYGHIRFIGKSLGAVVASYFLSNLSQLSQQKYSIVVLGYVTGSIHLKNFLEKIDIIQGSQDKFGDINTVKQVLQDCMSSKISFHEIAGADHSYRNPVNKEPIYEAQALSVLTKILSSH